MNEFKPVETLEDLNSLDDDEIFEGYREGLWGLGLPPGSDKSRSYWHGWRNGMVDSGRMNPTESMLKLAKDYTPVFIADFEAATATKH